MSTLPESREIYKLRLQNYIFKQEHRILFRFLALIFLGRSLKNSAAQWLRARREGTLSDEEHAELFAAVVRRLAYVGIVGLLFPGIFLIWQNTLISDQNRYFRESSAELRRQNVLQDDRNDLARRRDLIGSIYSPNTENSLRLRTESVITLVSLERSLLSRRLLPGRRIRLRALELGCRDAEKFDCVDLSGASLARVDFSDSDLRGANLSGADLRGCLFFRADLTGASLIGARLQYARFREDTTSLSALPLDVITSRIVKSREIPEDHARLLATELRASLNRGDLQPLDSLSWEKVIREELRANLDAATSAAEIDGVDWGVGSSWSVNQHTRLPFKLYVGTPRNTARVTPDS